MARCFCGCGRKVSFGDRRANRAGQRTLDALSKLRAIQEGLDGDLSPLTKELEQRAGLLGIPPEELPDTSDVIAEAIDHGEAYLELWRSAVHGETVSLADSAVDHLGDDAPPAPITNALAHLPPLTRLPIVLRHVENADREQIAEATGAAPDVAEQTLVDAEAQLDGHLRRGWAEWREGAAGIARALGNP